MQSLSTSPKTTAEIAEDLPDVPVSSLYRHLKLLLKGRMINVSETRIVQGIQEKKYELVQTPRVRQQDLEGMNSEEHLHLFATYLVSLLQGFGQYVDASVDINYEVDKTGYTEVDIQASSEEFDALSKKLNAAVIPVLQNKPGPTRRLRKLAIITFPLDLKGEEIE